MDSILYENYLNILRQELVPALGCTEPIAIAYTAAKARQILGEFPDSVEMELSGNIIKNVKGVTVPNSGGMKGMEVAAVLGIVGGNADKALEVLSEVTCEDIAKTKELINQKICSCSLVEGRWAVCADCCNGRLPNTVLAGCRRDRSRRYSAF